MANVSIVCVIIQGVAFIPLRLWPWILIRDSVIGTFINSLVGPVQCTLIKNNLRWLFYTSPKYISLWIPTE